MYRATTPTHIFTLPFDADSCSEIQVTYKQNEHVFVKHYQDGTLPAGMTLDGKDVNIFLTQEDTLAFTRGKAQVQIRVLKGGKVMASQKMNVAIYDVINEEVLS